MLDSWQRTTIEAVREHKGKITLVLNNDDKTSISTAFPDERFNKDIAIALQGYYARHNRYYGDEDKADL